MWAVFYLYKSQFKMKLILRLLLTALAVVILSYVLPGVSVEGYFSAILVAVVLALLRLTVKPIIILLTLPVTIVTLGLFLLFINAFIILLADYFVSGFSVASIWWALLFSLLLSFLQSMLFSMLEEK
jgi:putative membrane protein